MRFTYLSWNKMSTNWSFSFNHLLFGWRIFFNFASPKLKVKSNYRVYFLHRLRDKKQNQNKRTNNVNKMRLHFTRYSFNCRLKAKQNHFKFCFCWWTEALHRIFFCGLKYICIEDDGSLAYKKETAKTKNKQKQKKETVQREKSSLATSKWINRAQ